MFKIDVAMCKQPESSLTMLFVLFISAQLCLQSRFSNFAITRWLGSCAISCVYMFVYNKEKQSTPWMTMCPSVRVSKMCALDFAVHLVAKAYRPDCP